MASGGSLSLKLNCNSYFVCQVGCEFRPKESGMSKGTDNKE